MIVRTGFSGIVMLLALMLIPVESRGDVNDLFDELDSIDVSSAEDTNDEPKSVLSQFGSHYSGKMTLRGQHFFHEPVSVQDRGVNANPDLFESRLEMSSWAGSENWRFTSSGWLEWGNEKDIWRGYSTINEFLQNKQHYRHNFELNESYFRFYFDAVDITLGKMIFKNGICPLFSPSDRYSPSDFNDPIESRELGTWLGQIDMNINNSTITAAVFPAYQSSRIPSEGSRWMSAVEFGSDPDGNRIPLAFQAGVPEETLPKITLDNMGYFLRGKTTYRGWDVFASVYYGLNSQNVYYGDKVTVQIPTADLWGFVDVDTYDVMSDLVNVTHGATGFSTTYGKWEFHGEGVYNYTFESKDDDFISYVTGFSYSMDDIAQKLYMKSMKLYVDYAGEEVTKEQSAKDYLISSRNARFGGKDFIIGENDMVSYVTFNVTDDLDIHSIALKHLSKSGSFLRVIGNYRLNDSISYSVSYDRFSGASDSFIGRWDKNDRVTTSLFYYF